MPVPQPGAFAGNETPVPPVRRQPAEDLAPFTRFGVLVPPPLPATAPEPTSAPEPPERPGSRSPARPPDVQVTIGRLEVRAPAVGTPTERRLSRPTGLRTLGEYGAAKGASR